MLLNKFSLKPGKESREGREGEKEDEALKSPKF